MEQKFMDEAVRLSEQCMKEGHGGPFGCVIVRNGKIIARGWNNVLINKDPTAHAEMTAIRNACKILNRTELTGCDLYTSCEPCPMCMGAIYWAHLNHVFYANTRNDAAALGFDDSFIYKELKLNPGQRAVPMTQMDKAAAQAVFAYWQSWEGKRIY